MEIWQIVFVNIAIYGFIFQIFLIIGVFSIAKSLPKDKNDKEFLEDIYIRSSISHKYFKNLKF